MDYSARPEPVPRGQAHLLPEVLEEGPVAVRPQKPASLKDVARRAKVSTATVSRVLNNRSPVSEAARRRVLHAAREMDYHPDWLARSLRGQRTDTIGLMRLMIRSSCGCPLRQA